MTTLSLPSQSFAAASPLAAVATIARRWGRAAWAVLTEAPRHEPRTPQEVRAWARSLQSSEPGFAAELVSIASRSPD